MSLEDQLAWANERIAELEKQLRWERGVPLFSELQERGLAVATEDEATHYMRRVLNTRVRPDTPEDQVHDMVRVMYRLHERFLCVGLANLLLEWHEKMTGIINSRWPFTPGDEKPHPITRNFTVLERALRQYLMNQRDAGT